MTARLVISCPGLAVRAVALPSRARRPCHSARPPTKRSSLRAVRHWSADPRSDAVTEWLTGSSCPTSRFGAIFASALAHPSRCGEPARIAQLPATLVGDEHRQTPIGPAVRSSAVSDIHVRLIGAGLICGALSRVMNPISGRASLLDFSVIASSGGRARPVSITNEQFTVGRWSPRPGQLGDGVQQLDLLARIGQQRRHGFLDNPGALQHFSYPGAAQLPRNTHPSPVHAGCTVSAEAGSWTPGCRSPL